MSRSIWFQKPSKYRDVVLVYIPWQTLLLLVLLLLFILLVLLLCLSSSSFLCPYIHTLEQASATYGTRAKRGTWNDFQWHAE